MLKEDRDLDLISEMIPYLSRIKEVIKDVAYDIFIENQDSKDIVCFNIIQIGEIASKLSNDFIQNNKEIEWEHIRGMRNRIVHGYGGTDFYIVWETSHASIDELYAFCCNYIKNIK